MLNIQKFINFAVSLIQKIYHTSLLEMCLQRLSWLGRLNGMFLFSNYTLDREAKKYIPNKRLKEIDRQGVDCDKKSLDHLPRKRLALKKFHKIFHSVLNWNSVNPHAQ